jgi:hypothetical protein
MGISGVFTDTFNDLFMGYITVMHDAWVDFFY